MTAKKLDPNVREQLRFVKTTDEDYDFGLFPDFLIIGPQRTGTTWLHRNLVKHPQIFMPADKELYYFNTLRTAEYHPKDLPPVSPELAWYLKYFTESKKEVAAKDKECRKAYGEPYEVAVRGEGTATYAAGLDLEIIGEILRINPEMKAILMVRHPIERAWSHAKKDLSKNVGVPLDEVTNEQFEEFFSRFYQLECGQYSKITAMWEPLLKPGHLFTGRFDDVQDDPQGLLLSIFDFLGVRSDAKIYVTELAAKRINPTQQAPVPERFRKILEDVFADELQKLAAKGFRWDR